MMPSRGQIWSLTHKGETIYYFIVGIREEDSVYSGWVYWYNMSHDVDSNSSMDWFIKNCQLVSG
jgi:hypothetical protein